MSDITNKINGKFRGLVHLAIQAAMQSNMGHAHGAVLTYKGGNRPLTTACNDGNRSRIKGETPSCSVHAEVGCIHLHRQTVLKGSGRSCKWPQAV